jgi:hypothetical protein
MVGDCEHGNANPRSIKDGQFLDRVSDIASQEGLSSLYGDSKILLVSKSNKST